jgi:hypothetical protein
LFNFARNLVLTCGELLDALPQRYQPLRHLLHLRRVEGGAFGAPAADAICATDSTCGRAASSNRAAEPSS